jgi:hypothetical protein
VADLSALKLGKLPPRHDPRTLKLSTYAADLPSPPPEVDWSTKAKRLGMLLNDQLGDCGLAAPLHLMQCMTAENGVEYVPTDAEALAAYKAIGNYRPGQPETDNGVVMLDVMNAWRRDGIAGKKIDAYVALDLRNRLHFKQTIACFGGVILGFSLPLSCRGQDEWTVSLGGSLGDPTPGSYGGHAVSGHASRDESLPNPGITIVSWGQRMHVSWDFLDAYCDEAYAVVSSDWADADGAPSGFDIEALRADLKAVGA